MNSIVPLLSSSKTCLVSLYPTTASFEAGAEAGGPTDVEDVFGKLRWITEGEELPVDLLELCEVVSVFGAATQGAVLVRQSDETH